MNQFNNKICYSDKDLKILKKSIQVARNLNWNKKEKKNKDVNQNEAA